MKNFNLYHGSKIAHYFNLRNQIQKHKSIAKIQFKFAEISFCKKEVSVDVTNVGSESHTKFIDPISRVMYRNCTLTLCNRVHPTNAFELGNGSGYHMQNN